MNAFRRTLRELFRSPVEVDMRSLEVAQAQAEAARAELASLRRKLAAAEAGLAYHREPTSPDLDVIRRRNDRALREVQAVVDGGPDRWRNSFPGRPGYDTDSVVNAALFDGQNLMREVGQLRELVHEILGRFTQPGHPGEPCRSTGWIPEKQLTAWRQAAGPTPQPQYAHGGAITTPAASRLSAAHAAVERQEEAAEK